MNSSVKTASSRYFGILVGGVFFVVGALKFNSGAPSYPAWVSLGAFLLLVALLVPRLLRPIKNLWLRLGHLLARVFSPVALTLIYVVSIVPIGLLLKAFRKDTLHRTRDPKSTTYWILRQPPGPAPDSFKHQF
jgi:hypothetical protein